MYKRQSNSDIQIPTLKNIDIEKSQQYININYMAKGDRLLPISDVLLNIKNIIIVQEELA